MISNQSLTCPKGASLTFEIDMDTGSDLTGATAQWALCESWFDQAKVYLTKTGVGDGLFIGQDGGVWKITVNLAPTDTLDIPSGLLYHDCKVLLQSGDVEDVANGPFFLDPSVNILLTNAPITRNLRSVPQALGHLGQTFAGTVGALSRNLVTTQPLAGIGQTAIGTVSSSLSSQVTQFFNRLITMPTTARQSTYASLIDGLVTAGVWSKLDCLYAFAAADIGTSLVNLIGPSPAGLIHSGGSGPPTFTADLGFSACGAPALTDVDTGLSPTTGGINYTQNDAMVCAWQIGTTEDFFALFTTEDNAARTVLISKNTDHNTYWGINTDGAAYTNSGASAPDGSGFWLMQRTGATASELHRNDTAFATSTMASATLQAPNICGDARLNTIGVLGIGASLTSAQQTALYNGLSTYLTAVGAI